MEYEYYKTKYQKITLQLDREKDADVIEFLDRFPGHKRQVICECLRFLIKQIGKEEEHVNKNI